MSGPAWFVDPRPVRHEIVFPGAKEVAESMRHEQIPEEEVEAYLAERTMTIEVRGLTAGDKATLDELRFTQDGDARLSFGENQLILMEMAIASWSLEAPVNKETIRRLDPLVAAAIIEKIPEGKLTVEGERERATGSGPPSPAATEPPAQAREAATET